MKAVNLIPRDGARAGFASNLSLGPGYAVLAVLAVAVVFVTVYVLTNNTISTRRSQLADLQAQVQQEHAAATQLADYVRFAKLAEARAKTVREIAETRFDWHGALADLAKVVPANTSLQSLTGTVAPQAASTSSGSGTSSALRGDLNQPAIELSGCSKNQDDVARLMSRLRLINGVTRVTLGDSTEAGGAGTGSAAPATPAGGGCGANAPTWDMVMFFSPLQGADPTTGAPTGGESVSSTTPASGG